MSALIDESMKEELTKIIDENLSWLENNQSATKEEYDSKIKNFQESMKPEKMMGSMPQNDFAKTENTESLSNSPIEDVINNYLITIFL